MSEPDAPIGPADDELIAAVRSGDLGAFGTLFERHQDAARRLARQLTRGGADADDLVAGAFEKVMDQLRAGKGPDVAFRAYLLTAMRRLHVDQVRAVQRVRPTEDADLDRGIDFEDSPLAAFEQGTAAAAFASLPERWQTVLWHLDVEGEKPAAVAPLLGMSANSVSALAYRAREGLRRAYLQQHLAPQVEDDHQWTLGNLGAFVRGGLAKRDTAKVREHLDRCARCSAVYLELDDVNARLGAILGPAVLGTAAAGYLGAAGGGAKVLALVGGWWSSGRSWVAGSTTNTVVAAVGAVTVAAVAGGLVYVVATHGDDEVSASLADRDPAGDRDGSGSPDADAPGAVPPTALPPGALPPGTTPPLVPRTPAATPPGVGAPGVGAPGVGAPGVDAPGTEVPGAGPQGGATGDGTDGDGNGADGDGSGDPDDGGSGGDGGFGGDGDGDGGGDPAPVPLGTPEDVAAAVTATADGVRVTWTGAAGAEGYDVFRDDSVAGGGAALVRAAVPTRVNGVTLPSSARAYVDDPPAPGTYTYTVRAVRDGRHGPAGSSSASRVVWASQLAGRGQLRARSVLPQETQPRCLVATGGVPALGACDATTPDVIVRGRTVRVGGLCLTATAQDPVLRACDGSAAQDWTLATTAQGGTRIETAVDGPRALQALASGGLTLRPVLTGSARQTRAQRFDLPGVDGSNPALPDDPDPTFLPPSRVAAVVTGTSAEVTWDAADDVDGYVVERDGEKVGTTSGVRLVETGLQPGRHAYTVRSLRDGAESAPSTRVGADVQPAPPGGVRAVVDGPAVTVSWSLPAGADGAVVFRDGVPVARPAVGTTSFTETVAAGTYAYAVASVQDQVLSAAAGIAPVTVRPPLTAPGSFTATEQGSGVRLTWSAAEDVDGYRLTRDGAVVADDVRGTAFVDAEVPDGPHTWTVRAVRDDGTAGPVATVVRDVGLTATDRLRFADTYTGGVRYCVHPDGGVVIRSCEGSPTWRFYDDGTIRATADDRCLRADSQDVSLATTCAGPAAVWRPDGSSAFGGRFLTNGRAAGLVLDAEGGLMRSGDALIVYPRKADGAARTGNDNQRFDLPAGWTPGTPPPAAAR